MDELLVHLEQMTQQFIIRLNETTYEEVEKFVEERQVKVDQILTLSESQFLTVEQKRKMESILRNDEMISQRMLQLKIEAQDWLLQRNMAKTQRNAYESAYTPDSILMDRRK
jgi:glycyl-tRNA synthetase (class II)